MNNIFVNDIFRFMLDIAPSEDIIDLGEESGLMGSLMLPLIIIGVCILIAFAIIMIRKSLNKK